MTVPLVDGTGSVAMDAMVPEQMTYQEQAIGGARLEDRLPMLILLHGKFGRPEYISAPFAGLHTPARLIALRGVPMGNGFVWWDQHEKTTDPRTFAAAANEASRRVDAFVGSFSRSRRWGSRSSSGSPRARCSRMRSPSATPTS